GSVPSLTWRAFRRREDAAVRRDGDVVEPVHALRCCIARARRYDSGVSADEERRRKLDALSRALAPLHRELIEVARLEFEQAERPSQARAATASDPVAVVSGQRRRGQAHRFEPALPREGRTTDLAQLLVAEMDRFDSREDSLIEVGIFHIVISPGRDFSYTAS